MTSGMSHGEHLNQLHPVLQEAILDIFAIMEDLGHPMKLTSSYRSLEEQAAEYAKGRNGDPRDKVTNSKPGTSWHNWREPGRARAGDSAFVGSDPYAEKSPALWELFEKCVRHAQELNSKLVWGGDFGGKPGKGWDKPHLQLPGPISIRLLGSSVSKPLRKFTQGVMVRELQQHLATVLGSTLEADGIFGLMTEAAVKALQRNRGLEVDGVVGPSTIIALEAELEDE